jgi:hypothetical protein
MHWPPQPSGQRACRLRAACGQPRRSLSRNHFSRNLALENQPWERCLDPFDFARPRCEGRLSLDMTKGPSLRAGQWPSAAARCCCLPGAAARCCCPRCCWNDGSAMGHRVGPLPSNFPSNASSNDEREPVLSSATRTGPLPKPSTPATRKHAPRAFCIVT